MPSIIRIGEFTIYFWSNENDEPVHVHISKRKPTPNATKVWITSTGGVLLEHNKSRIPASKLNSLLRIIEGNREMLVLSWYNHFGYTKFIV